MKSLWKGRNPGAVSLGVDVGTHAVKFMIAENAGGRVEIRGAGSFPLQPGMVVEGVITNPKRFARQLSAELAAIGQKPAEGTVSIPSNLATLRWIQLPPLTGEERRQAARFKVKRHLPFPVEKAYLDAAYTEPSGQSLVIAVRKEVVDSRAEALEQAGIVPVAAELEGQAILRVVERQLNEKSVLWRDASLTIIDVGGANTHMYVVQNQRLQFIRGVRFGSEVIAQAVSQGLEMPIEDAHLLLAQPETELRLDGTLVMSTADGACVLNVRHEMDKLIREFLRLLRYFRSLHPERSYAGILDHVVVCGGLVGLAGFTEYLQQELGIRVERARPFVGMVAQLRLETFQTVSSHQEAYTVVTGLTLAGLDAPKTRTGETDARSEFEWTRAA